MTAKLAHVENMRNSCNIKIDDASREYVNYDNGEKRGAILKFAVHDTLYGAYFVIGPHNNNIIIIVIYL
jgi:hypothetical protein